MLRTGWLVIALTAMVTCSSMTAHAADQTLTLACQGTATSITMEDAKPAALEDSIKIELSCTSKNAPDLKEMRVAYEAKNGQSTYFYPVYVTKDGTWFGVIDNYRRTYQIDWVGGTAKSDYLMSYWWFGEHKQKPRMKLYYKLTLFADHTATLEDEHTGDKKLDKIVYKCTEVHHPRIPKDEAETGTGRPDPDSWYIVKDLTSNSCAVLARKPINKDVVILTSFKGYVTGGKAMKDMVAAECGCEKGCTWELPR